MNNELDQLRIQLSYMKKNIYNNLEEKRKFISKRQSESQDPKLIDRLKSEKYHIENVESIMFMYESLIDRLSKELSNARHTHKAYFELNCKLMDKFEKDIQQEIKEISARLAG